MTEKLTADEMRERIENIGGALIVATRLIVAESEKDEKLKPEAEEVTRGTFRVVEALLFVYGKYSEIFTPMVSKIDEHRITFHKEAFLKWIEVSEMARKSNPALNNGN